MFIRKSACISTWYPSALFNLLMHCRKATRLKNAMNIKHKLNKSGNGDPDEVFLHVGDAVTMKKAEFDVRIT